MQCSGLLGAYNCALTIADAVVVAVVGFISYACAREVRTRMIMCVSECICVLVG